jgi:hypothetical protein
VIGALADALDSGGWQWLVTWLPADLPAPRSTGPRRGRGRPPWQVGEWANLQAFRGDHRLACDFWRRSLPVARCRLLAGLVAEHPPGELEGLVADSWPRPDPGSFAELVDRSRSDRGDPPQYALDPKRWGTGFFVVRLDDPRQLAYLAGLPPEGLSGWLRNHGPFTIRPAGP